MRRGPHYITFACVLAIATLLDLAISGNGKTPGSILATCRKTVWRGCRDFGLQNDYRYRAAFSKYTMHSLYSDWQTWRIVVCPAVWSAPPQLESSPKQASCSSTDSIGKMKSHLERQRSLRMRPGIDKPEPYATWSMHHPSLTLGGDFISRPTREPLPNAVASGVASRR
ncbi:hypothetical protein LZ31DRAFT_168519 [Colletotrichum somersetense]|nr:hypothetical protein LZ31DRAFT_168519 [Colletotrichum somersetense]